MAKQEELKSRKPSVLYALLVVYFISGKHLSYGSNLLTCIFISIPGIICSRPS